MLKCWGAAETKKEGASGLPSAHDDQSMMKICLMTSLAKLLFITPGEARPVLAKALKLGADDVHPGVKAKAIFLYNLIKSGIEEARATLVTNKQSMDPFVEDADAENIDMVFDEFNTFSVVYEKPECDWNKEQEEIDLEGIKALFDKALDDVTRALAAGLCDVAPTDVLAVVSVAVSSCDDELDAFDEAADAAEEATAGTGDPVSLSVARFLRGLAQA